MRMPRLWVVAMFAGAVAPTGVAFALADPWNGTERGDPDAGLSDEQRHAKYAGQAATSDAMREEKITAFVASGRNLGRSTEMGSRLG
ncbi:MAG: hypothetical protein ACKVVT_15185 [Dehalococcoidia bacterium]